MRGRELHEFILDQIERRLHGRSWAWLAREADLPRSTLMTQKRLPKFSVEVVVRVAETLECGFEDLVSRRSEAGEQDPLLLLRQLQATLVSRLTDAPDTGTTEE